jgi:hypothetical protein
MSGRLRLTASARAGLLKTQQINVNKTIDIRDRYILTTFMMAGF